MERFLATALGLMLTFFSAQVGHAKERPCTAAEGRHALDQADMLRSWEALYRSYESYRQCDDGGVAEGYSESVARILVDHWNALPQLKSLSEKDPQFRRFVLQHLDATLNMDDVEMVKKRAKTKCPVGLRALCSDLSKQADFAIKDNARR